MTLYLWMHWFWITVLLGILISLSECVPISSIADEPPAVTFDSFIHHTTSLAEDEDDVIGDTRFPLPLHIFPTAVLTEHDEIEPHEFIISDEHHLPSSYSPEVSTTISPPVASSTSITKLNYEDDNPDPIMLSDEQNSEESSQLYARDTSLLANRNPKAIGREFITSSTIPPPSPTPTPNVTNEHKPSTIAPPDLPDLTSKNPPPNWVPTFSSEEDEENTEGTLLDSRPDASVLNEQQTPVPTDSDISSEAITKGMMTSDQGLDASSIIGIIFGLLVLVTIIGGAVGYVLYRRQFLNKPQTLNDKCSNADSSGYIDDTLRVSCLNSAGNIIGRAIRGNRVSAVENTAAAATTSTTENKTNRAQQMTTFNQSIKDNSEEMYSLDNDSFLNSLEAMTIQNYWTDSVKHTKL